MAVTKAERTREILLAHAIARFAAVGYQAASVAEICREARMSTTAAYPYFRNKEELFAAAVDADVEGLIRDSSADVLEGRFDLDWTNLFGRLFAALERHPLARRVLAGEEGRGAERLFVLPAEAALRDGLAASLGRLQRGGKVRRDIDPAVMAVGLETLVVTVLIASLQSGGVPDLDRVNGVMSVFDAAVQPAPRASSAR